MKNQIAKTKIYIRISKFLFKYEKKRKIVFDILIKFQILLPKHVLRSIML